MPRIRKKTSKRGTTHQRAKVKHKVSESRKKAKKEAKKNTQWKSKKDPGIPNNFPYKDQILAEVAAQRRQDEEEKQRRKELKKAAKAGQAVETNGDDEATGFDGITNIGTSTLKIASKVSPSKVSGIPAEAEEDDVPILMNSEYVSLKAVLDKADVVLQVLDARDPLAFQSSHIDSQKIAEGKGKNVFVLNKIDTCPRETVQSWLSNLRNKHRTFLFRSARAFLPNTSIKNQKSDKQPSGPLSMNDGAGVDVLLKALSLEAKRKTDSPLVVAIVGIANSGKSSLVNSLLRKSTSPIYKLTSSPPSPSTTERPLEVTLDVDGKEIHLIDTPALSWEPTTSNDEATAQTRVKDMLLRNKGRIDRAKDPIPPIEHIVSRANNEDLMLLYNLPAFTKGDEIAFLSALARANGLIKKHGEPDLPGAARIVLRDWSTGKLPWYTQPPAGVIDGAVTSVDAELSSLYASDEAILDAAGVMTRKEMRRGSGLVRLSASEVEARKANLEVLWDENRNEDDSSEEGDEDEDGVEEESDEEDSASEPGDEDDVEDGSSELGTDQSDSVNTDGEEEDDLPPPPKGKRKRQEKSAPAPAPKKVAFAPAPKGTKQARAQPPSKQNKRKK